MIQVFCDFDGTITTRDTIVFLTEHFGAGPRFRKAVFDDIHSGRITVFEAIRRELQTVSVGWPQARAALLEQISIDADFGSFVRWCRKNSLPLTVVSSGLEPVVDLFVSRWQIPFVAQPVEFDPRGWRYHRREERTKPVILQAARRRGEVIYIGDGTSDVAAIPYVDQLFATGYLAQHCRGRGHPFLPFDCFGDILLQLQSGSVLERMAR